MPGGGDHFSDKLMQEVKAAMALLTRTLQTDGIDTSLSVDSVVYPTDFPTDTGALDTQCHLIPALHDGLLETRMRCASEALAMLPATASIIGEDCTFEAALVSESVFSSAEAVLNYVSFENIRKPKSGDLPVTEIDLPSTIYQIPVPTSSTRVLQALLPKIDGPKDTHKIPFGLFRRQTHVFPLRFWQLPLVKTPIPPHRFSAELKAKFRKAIAEKAHGENSNLPQANIQLQVVYDRINLSLFSSIDQDDRGHLICYPKPEFLRNPSLVRDLPSTYLVVGMRMDNRQTYKALVPMDDE